MSRKLALVIFDYDPELMPGVETYTLDTIAERLHGALDPYSMNSPYPHKCLIHPFTTERWRQQMEDISPPRYSKYNLDWNKNLVEDDIPYHNGYSEAKAVTTPEGVKSIEYGCSENHNPQFEDWYLPNDDEAYNDWNTWLRIRRGAYTLDWDDPNQAEPLPIKECHPVAVQRNRASVAHFAYIDQDFLSTHVGDIWGLLDMRFNNTDERNPIYPIQHGKWTDAWSSDGDFSQETYETLSALPTNVVIAIVAVESM